jgi:predicted  nucleic acid-binding Zn-ribbon protein
VALLTDSSPPELHRTGETVHTFASVGSLTCVECGFALAASAMDSELPRCPTCGGSRFRRASIFERPTVDAAAVEPALSEPLWLAEMRTVETAHPRIAYEDGEPLAVELRERWTRVGRSAVADIRLDDASVSRRHALLVRSAAGTLSALDDRSLNGLFVNGERVDWKPLRDGDELEIGRYRLYVLTAD